jgi:hypothetical protein
MERWRRLYVLGEIDEGRYRQETAPIKRRLAELERPQEVLDVDIDDPDHDRQYCRIDRFMWCLFQHAERLNRA